MKKKIITLSLILVVLLVGCTTYNAELICEEYCGGEPISEYNGISYFLKCTSPDGWNLSSYQDGFFEVKCDVRN